jgi:hypothetical protein
VRKRKIKNTKRSRIPRTRIKNLIEMNVVGEGSRHKLMGLIRQRNTQLGKGPLIAITGNI